VARELIRPEAYRDVELVPFYQLHDARYVIYWRVATPESYSALTAKLASQEKARVDLDARTMDRVTPGEQQPEVEHAFQGEDSTTGTHLGRSWRDAGKWFSYELKIPGHAQLPADTALELRVSYFAGERDRRFDILVNDQVLETVELAGHQHDRFVDVSYPIPAALVRAATGSGILRVKFVAKEKSRSGSIYDVRLLTSERATLAH
jgi:hypothetical protein